VKASLKAAAGWLWDRCDLPHVSLLAVLAWTAHAHWLLAGQLDAPLPLQPLLSVALDVYTVAALHHRRDRRWALPLNGFAVAGAHAVHMASKTQWWAVQVESATGKYQWVLPALAAVWGVLLILVLWRVHEVAPTKRSKRVTERVKSQVSAEMDRSSEPDREPARLHSVGRSTAGHDDRAERVRALRAQGLTWTATAGQVGVSVSTAKRLAS